MRTSLVAIAFVLFPIFAHGASSGSATGDFNWNIGFGLGGGGIDFSDSTQRVNIGGAASMFEVGVHYKDFAFQLQGDGLSHHGVYDNMTMAGGLAIKWWFANPFSVRLKGGGASYRRTSTEGAVTTWTTYSGSYVGGELGWDIYTSGKFHFSLNSGASKFSFDTISITQGSVTTTTPLTEKLEGHSYFAYLGFDWYF